MKFVLILSLFSLNAFSIDTFSIVRRQGTHGKLGTSTLQLLCAEKQCQLSLSQNENPAERKNLTFEESNIFFNLAETAIKKAKTTAHAKKLSHITFVLEKNKVISKSFTATPELLKLEYKLQQKLKP